MRTARQIARGAAKAACIAALLAMPSAARARTFANAYVSFDIPSSWECNLEQSEWVCNEQENQRHSAIMIIAAKEVGPGDSLDDYYDHLAQPRMLMQDGKPLRRSQVRWVRRVVIGGQQWIDSEHFESELADFYTHYLATIRRNVAVLVTLSAHRTVYQGTAAAFDAVVRSLQVTDPTSRR